METKKLLRDVFRDFASKGEKVILNTYINTMNLYKKSNRLVIILETDSIIPLEEMIEFENFIKVTFKIREVNLNIKYNKDLNINIVELWDSITKVMAYKHITTKAILKDSIPEINNNALTVLLKVKGADILNKRGLDKELENLIKSYYDIDLRVKYVENEEKSTDETAYMEYKIANEKAVITETLAQIHVVKHEEKKAVSEESIEETEEKSQVILGRSEKFREAPTKVKDLSVDSGRVVLLGEVISVDSRELKNGKILLLFDLYDETSTITCKAFLENEKAKEIIQRVKDSKGIKLEGNVQYDPYAKEIGVISNHIVEQELPAKAKRQDNAKVKRVELHMHTQMSQMDAMTSAKDLIKRAMSWGMKSIAITDHGVVQAFPEAHKLLGRDNPDMKVIYRSRSLLCTR